MIQAISVLADDLRQPPFALVEFVASFPTDVEDIA